MIAEFKDEYEWLSNFYPVTVTYDQVVYPSVEHAYQAAKTMDLEIRKHILTLTQGQAKRYMAANKHEYRLGWQAMKLDVMFNLVYQKFSSHAELKELLLATGNQILIEGNTWHDTFWGKCRGIGENWLGIILMRVRTLLRCEANMMC